LLVEGRDAVTEVPPDRYDINEFYDPDIDAPGKTISRWGGFLDSIDQFDPMFFGISPRQEYLDIPFAFFGYCMGAHLSFELARQLRRQSSPLPEHLFIAARHAPQLPDPNPHCYRLSEPLFLRAVSNLNGLPAEFLENKELVRMMMPTLRADFEAAETYRYTDEEPFNRPFTVFGGTEDYSVTSDELVAWHHQTTGTFRFHLFPGDHFFIHSHQANLLKTISGEITQIIGD
jgi:surfactin synthase thioesterase subunit